MTSAPLRPRATLLWAFVGFLLLEVAWATALPLFGGPDEIPHVYRASAVAEGQWEPSGGETPTTVSRGIADAARATCLELYDDLLPEVCAVTVDEGGSTVGVTSTAGSYNPAYYAVIGAPARLLDGAPAVRAMRALSAVACAALLAWAWVLFTGRARTPFPALAFLLAVSPAVVFGAGVVAPNGIQYASALLLWSGIVTALGAAEGAARTGPIAACAVGGSLLAVTHTLGPVWLATIVATGVVLAGWGRLRAVVRRAPRAWGVAAGLVALAVLAGVLWTLGASTNAPSPGGEPLSEETKQIGLVPNVVLWLLQTVGTMPFRFGLLWFVLYLFWLVPLGTVLVRGWRRSGRRVRWALLVVAAASVAIPTVLTVLTYDDLGYAWQGKYGLPLLFGGVLLAGRTLDAAESAPGSGPVRGTWALLGLTHYLAVLCIGLRDQPGAGTDGGSGALLLLGLAPVAVVAGWILLARTAGLGGLAGAGGVGPSGEPRSPIGPLSRR